MNNAKLRYRSKKHTNIHEFFVLLGFGDMCSHWPSECHWDLSHNSDLKLCLSILGYCSLSIKRIERLSLTISEYESLILFH